MGRHATHTHPWLAFYHVGASHRESCEEEEKKEEEEEEVVQERGREGHLRVPVRVVIPVTNSLRPIPGQRGAALHSPHSLRVCTSL